MARGDTKYFAAELYPDSAPSNWRDIITLSGVRCAVSPLHDKDVDESGKPKKPHYHLIIKWSGPTSLSCVRNYLSSKLNQNGFALDLQSPKGYYDYFTHKKNPEKYQYNEGDITLINDFDTSDLDKLTPKQTEEVLNDIEDIVREHNFKEYKDVLFYLRDNGTPDMVRVFRSHSIHFNSLLRSSRYANRGAYYDSPPMCES